MKTIQKIKNEVTKINKLSLLGLAAGVIFFCSFRGESHQMEIEYGKHVDGSTVEWIQLDNLDQKSPGSPLNSGEYACDLSPNENCSAFFPADETPTSSTPDPDNGQTGSFRYEP